MSKVKPALFIPVSNERIEDAAFYEHIDVMNSGSYISPIIPLKDKNLYRESYTK